MKYVELTRFGLPWEVCRIVEGPSLGSPGPGEVNIKVEAGPINPAELLLIEGKYASRPPLPARLGIEGVGTITAVGDGVNELALGDRVMSLGRTNWAEEIQVSAGAVVKVPKDADVQQLSMLKVNPATAMFMLERYVNLKPGDWVIQNAANSAVGRYIIQLAKTKGVKTLNVVRRTELFGELRKIGADVVLLQEVYFLSKRSAYINQVQYLLDNTSLNFGAYASMYKTDFAPSDGLGMVDGGNVVLSKYKLEDAQRIPLALRTDQSSLEQYFYLRRNILKVKIPELSQNGKDFYAVNVHATAFATDDTKQKHIDKYIEILNEINSSGDLYVSGGDLN